MKRIVRLCLITIFGLIHATGSCEMCYTKDCFALPIPVAAEVSLAYDTFRGTPEGSWSGSTGAVVGANIGFLPVEWLGVQLGGSYGVYDWHGRGRVCFDSSNGAQQLGFLTGGFFYKAPCFNGLQGGVVIDWMLNKNLGIFAANPSLGQVRLQAGYLFNMSDELGIWGTVNINKEKKVVCEIPVSFRAISQVNLFWRHIFANGSETMVWAGLPYKKSLMFPSKRAGAYVVGGSVRAPLSSRLSVEAYGSYMGPQGNSYSPRFQNEQVNVYVGLSYAFGFGPQEGYEMVRARPYLPIANNSTFFVDTSLNN